LGNQFLSHIRETQAIVVVLRVFRDPDIIHVESSVDAARDLEIIESELVLKDLDSVGKRLAKAESEARSGKKEALADRDELARVEKFLADGQPLSGSAELLAFAAGSRAVRELNLLTAKRQIFLLNGEEAEVPEGLKKKMAGLGGEFLVADLAAADHVPDLIKKAYEALGLISFFTTGEDETRAWTIERGTLAPRAAGVIHTDFENRFIRMEVVPCDKLLEAGGWTQAKQKGWLRVEGKEYEVKDGDVIVVRHG
ncbi:MAG TPA: DUF933 domain-containing protein, partial [Candidatus Paceibacterota bacterium]|nr:DUF933 domain-containing protein [Candidatus Paceibacterota bacterium]